MVAVFNLQHPQQLVDPYPLYRRLRSEDPVHWDFILGGWLLTRYADVWAMLRDRRLTTRNFPWDVTQLPPDLQADLDPLGRIVETEVLYTDLPVHERLRTPLNHAFGPPVFERLRPQVETVADRLLDRVAPQGHMDVVTDLAHPLMVYMTGDLLGVPAEDTERFVGWCDDISTFLTAGRPGDTTIVLARQAVTSLRALRAYLRPMIGARRQEFHDDVIGRTVVADGSEPRLTEDELLANCVFFLRVGAKNTADAIGNAVLALLRHPGELEKLRENPRLMTTALDELLRYDTPVHVAIRGVEEEIELGGKRIAKKQLLLLLLGAANRDPEQFPEPNRLDISRRPNRHLAFGVGLHGCVGAWMARFGLEIAITTILRRLPRLRLAPVELEWRPTPPMMRALSALPVLF